MSAETDIAAVADSGDNTPATVRAALTSVLARADVLEPGPAGADGADGADGLSAYELAVAGGYVGDVTTWLASLKGEQGDTGDTGPQGEQGEPGVGGGNALDAYPVGSIYMSVLATSPATLFGGTWQRIQGQFLVGFSDSDTDFDLGDTGGAKDVTLTSAQSGVPAHVHQQTAPTSASGGIIRFATDSNASGADTAGNNATQANAAADAAQAHENLPPFRAVAMWIRTA